MIPISIGNGAFMFINLDFSGSDGDLLPESILGLCLWIFSGIILTVMTLYILESGLEGKRLSIKEFFIKGLLSEDGSIADTVFLSICFFVMIITGAMLGPYMGIALIFSLLLVIFTK